MDPVSFNFLTERYGNPVLRFTPHGEFTLKERIDNPIPQECAIFRINKTYEYITCYRLSDGDQWDWGNDRFSIRELLRIIKAEGIKL